MTATDPFGRASTTVRVKVVPPPRRGATAMSPPIARASCFTEDSPSPAPPKRDAMLTLACENGRNRRLISASVKPDAAVGDREGDTDRAFRARCRRGPQRDAAAFGKLHRIVDQVFQRRAETDRIADHEGRDLLRNLDGRAQALGRRPARQRIAGVAGERAQIEKVPPNRQSGFAAFRGIDEQGRQAGQMFRAGLDGIDPAPLALVKVGRCEEIADGEDSGERRAHLMREGGERGLDHAG